MNPPPPPPAAKPKTTSRIYIDGFNFYYGVIKDTGHKWLDLQDFFTRLRSDDDIHSIWYFTARLSGPERANQHTYLQALDTLPLVEVVCSNHKTEETTCGVNLCTYAGDRTFLRLREKRTDVSIAVKMVTDAFQNACDRFVLVSGDSDLVPAVQQVAALGKEVLVYIPARTNQRGQAAELRAVATRHKTLPTTLLSKSHFPDQVPNPAGGFFDKPAAW